MSIVEEQVLPLDHGQRLSRDEFLRRWEAMPNLKAAELIGGVVYMPSPVSTEHIVPSADGILRSIVFPGLWLHPQALLNKDAALVLATLQQGLQSPEHAAFVQELQHRGAGGLS